jgi:stress response protein SCP2
MVSIEDIRCGRGLAWLRRQDAAKGPRLPGPVARVRIPPAAPLTLNSNHQPPNEVVKLLKVSNLFMVLPLVILLCAPASVQADEVRSVMRVEGPSTVKAGVWIISVEKVDPAGGTFTIDFYLWFKYGEIKPNIEFLNGSPSRIEKITERENYIEYRVKGTFVKPLDFRNFPFDEHLLTVELEDKECGVSKLVFEPDLEESGMDPELAIVGWSAGDFQIFAVEHSYPDENYSRLVFGVTIYRSKLSVVLKNFLPIIVITLISLLTFSISVKNFGQRVGICVTTLMSAVAYHLAALGALPPLGYLTLLDRVMLVVYTLFLYNLAVSVQAMRLVEGGKVAEAEKFETKMQNLLPMIIIILCAIYIGLIGLFA